MFVPRIVSTTKFGKTDDGKRTYWLREITWGLLPAGFLPDFRRAISVCHPSLEMNKGSSKDPWWTECITQWKIWRALCGDSRLKFANVAKSDTLLLKCSWHENVYFIFLLDTYVYYNLKIVETTLSSFAFFRYKYMFPPKTKSHLKLKLVCFECEKTRNLLKEIFRFESAYYTYQADKQQNRNFRVIYTLIYSKKKTLFSWTV